MSDLFQQAIARFERALGMQRADADIYVSAVWLGITVMSRHPEWAQAFSRELGKALLLDPADAADELVEDVPIAIADEADQP